MNPEQRRMVSVSLEMIRRSERLIQASRKAMAETAEMIHASKRLLAADRSVARIAFKDILIKHVALAK